MSRSDPHRRSPRFTLLVLLLLSITVITLDASDVPVVSAVRDAGSRVLSPVGGALGAIASPFRNAWGGITDYEELQAENERLRGELDEVRGAGIREENAEEQLRRLKAQLNIRFLGELETETARVVGGPVSNFEDFTVRIDKGANDGIVEGMAVVTNGGLVGRIQRAEPTVSVVQLLVHPDFVVGIRLGRTQDLGVGHGGGFDAPFVVDKGIDLDDPVRVGDAVLSSGLSDAVLPPDIPIGRVERVTPQETDRTQVLDVKPSAELSRLDVVQVVRWTPGP